MPKLHQPREGITYAVLCVFDFAASVTSNPSWGESFEWGCELQPSCICSYIAPSHLAVSRCAVSVVGAWLGLNCIYDCYIFRRLVAFFVSAVSRIFLVLGQSTLDIYKYGRI